MADPTPGALAPRRRLRLAADLPAAAVCALAQLADKRRPDVQFQPLEDGRVSVEAGSGAILGVLEVEAQLARPLALPARALLALQRRLPAGPAWLAIDAPAEGDGPALLRVVAVGADGSASVNTPAADPAGSVAGLLADVPVLAAENTVLVDPRLLRQALAVLQVVCPGPVTLEVARHDLIGVLMRGRPSDDSSVAACTLAIARCVPVEA